MTELVLDANTLIRGRGNLPRGEYITTPEVAEELKSQHSQNIYNNKDITVQAPGDESVEKVNSKAEEIKSPTSKADNTVVALAFERGSKVLSDDKGVQNLCLWMEVDFQAYMREEVDERMKWDVVCVDCGSSASGERCSVCGSGNIERKPV